MIDSTDFLLRCASVCQVKTVVRHGGLRLVTLTQSRLTYELQTPLDVGVILICLQTLRVHRSPEGLCMLGVFPGT